VAEPAVAVGAACRRGPSEHGRRDVYVDRAGGPTAKEVFAALP
jgi:hypothetical protein